MKEQDFEIGIVNSNRTSVVNIVSSAGTSDKTIVASE